VIRRVHLHMLTNARLNHLHCYACVHYPRSRLAPCRFDSNLAAYVPRNKQWIKDRVFAHLKKQAGQ
jgi:hypothetical protein